MKYIFIMLIIFCAYQTKAQDLIIKLNGDSVNCKIKEIGPLYISYWYNLNGQIAKGNIASKNVKNYAYNVLQPDSVFIHKTLKNKDKDGIGFYFSSSIGLGYLTAPLPDGSLPDFYKEYLTELNSGRSYHITGAYFVNSSIGLGLHYINFNTTNNIEKIIVYRKYDTIVGPLSDNITTHYIAPTVFFKLGNTKGKFLPVFALGLGYIDYLNHSSFALPYRITSSSLGFHASASLEYNMGYNFALSAKAGLFSAELTKITITDLTANTQSTNTLSEPESLSRIDLHIGFRYKFGNN